MSVQQGKQGCRKAVQQEEILDNNDRNNRLNMDKTRDKSVDSTTSDSIPGCRIAKKNKENQVVEALY